MRLAFPLVILTFPTVIFQIPGSGAATTVFVALSKNTKRTTSVQKTLVVGQLHVFILTAAAMFVSRAPTLRPAVERGPERIAWCFQGRAQMLGFKPLNEMPHQIHFHVNKMHILNKQLIN